MNNLKISYKGIEWDTPFISNVYYITFEYQYADGNIIFSKDEDIACRLSLSPKEYQTLIKNICGKDNCVNFTGGMFILGEENIKKLLEWFETEGMSRIIINVLKED